MDSQYFFEWALITILGGFVAILQWNAKKLHERVDTLEKGKASNDSVHEFKNEMREYRAETRAALIEINKNILSIVSKLR